MAGHSKWNNIKRRKEKTDAQKAKVFTKMGREIAVAVREGGADVASNPRLKDLIAKAKGMNVPNENINRIIKRAEGGEKDDYESILYEGYGPCGIAVMVETLTDNRNRSAANMRHYFDKYGAGLGQSGSVAFQFQKKGVIIIEGEALAEEALMDAAFEAGADDFDTEDNLFEIICPAAKVDEVAGILREKGFSVTSAQEEYLPLSTATVQGLQDIKKLAQLLDKLESDDDVQNVWHNLENEDELEQA